MMMQQLPLFTIESVHQGVARFNNRAFAGLTISEFLLTSLGIGKAKAVQPRIHNLIATRVHRALYHFGLGVKGRKSLEVVGDGRVGVARAR